MPARQKGDTHDLAHQQNPPCDPRRRDHVINKTDLPETTRRDLVSTITRVATILGAQPEHLLASVPDLRSRLVRVHPKAANISAKSWANIKANLTRAFVIAGLLPDIREQELTCAWLALLKTAPQRHHRYGLSRLARFCCSKGIEPVCVTDNVAGEFNVYLEQTQLAKPPRDVLKATVDTWNLVVRDGEDNLTALTPIRETRYRARKLTDYPSSLQEEIKEYKQRLAVFDLFAEEGPTKAHRPTSIRNVEAHIRQFLCALVSSGLEPHQITNLETVVQPAMVRAACTAIMDRHGGTVPTTLPNIMATLLAIARHYVKLSPEKLRELSRMRSQISARISAGEMAMSEKSVVRLQQFDALRNLAALLALPGSLMQRATEDPQRRYAGLEAMHAVAIVIFLAFPVHVQNLAALDIDRHLSSRRVGKKKLYSLRIEGSEVKNSVPLEVDLGEDASAFLDTYLRDFRHLVSSEPGTALFPQHVGPGPRKPSNLGTELTQRIYRETGLTVHAHLFRHLAAKLFLDQKPGEYETVRRLLGHKKLETTMKFYARLTTKAAAARYDTVVLAGLRGRKDD